MGHRSEHSHHPLHLQSEQEQLWYTRTVEQLTAPSNRLLVDVGCGSAPMAIELARVLSEEVKVLALDSNPDALAVAAANIEQARRTGRVTLIEHDLTDGVDAVRDQLTGADLIWASASLHHVGDQQKVITELAGLLGEGGLLALAEGGLAERHLPWDVGVGEPGLELRLEAAQGGWFARMRAELPGSVPMPYGWPTALRKAGLGGVTTASTVFEEPTPLKPAAVEAVLHDLAQRTEKLGSEGFIDESDRSAWEKLLDPHGPAWLGRRDDLFSLSARTLYVGYRQS